MAQIKRAAPVPVWWVRHPDHEVAIVRAPNWEQATVEAAKWWDVPWREVAALCELEKKELAPRCICQKCGERFHGEAVLCARCTIEARDRELNRRGNARRYWREMGPRKETGRETLKHER